MTCASCAARIERRLNQLDGVTATVNYATEQAKVHAARRRRPSTTSSPRSRRPATPPARRVAAAPAATRRRRRGRRADETRAARASG